MTLPTDQALAALAAGDTAAWTWVVVTWGPGLHAQARRICGEADLAEDAVQEALLHIRTAAGRFKPPTEGDSAAAAAGWILGVGRRCALELIRRRRRSRERDRRWRPESHAADAADDSDQEGAGRRLRQELAGLPAQQREILVQHYLEDMPYADIAAQRGISAGNARVCAHRGLERLRRRLGRGAALLGLPALTGQLQALAATLPAAAPAAATQAVWLAIPATTTAAIPAAIALGGLSTMAKTLIAAACVVAASLPLTFWSQAGAEERRREEARTEEPRREGTTASAASGTVAGTVLGTDHGKGVIELVDAQGAAHRFTPRWIGGREGGLDPEVLRQARSLRPGASVTVAWVEEEGRRIQTLTVASNGPESGTITGTLISVDKSKGAVEIEDAHGRRYRLQPHWRGGMPADGGGLDQETIAAVARHAPGDRVTIAWTWEERMRIERITRPE